MQVILDFARSGSAPTCIGAGRKKSSGTGLHSLVVYDELVYITQVNSTSRARRLAGLEVISQVLFTSEQPKKNTMAFVGILSQIKLFLFRLPTGLGRWI